uniref:Macaca fascicularis brain cDNA, clone: QflA-18818 n=1 Tax=Macaca fascicularis TaxID=9541 RepID=I7G5W7_MACFA|nr:unnamed protein product [Macaca fascicularis]
MLHYYNCDVLFSIDLILALFCYWDEISISFMSFRNIYVY